jgi:hypothetical protein
MINYFFKRLLQSILVMIVVAFVSFSLFNFVGDPVNSMTGEDASDERRAEVREVLGLNDPVYVQFSRFVGNIVQGNFGISYQLKREVSDLIGERLPATLELVFVSAMLAIIIRSARASMKNAANCVNQCELQDTLIIDTSNAHGGSGSLPGPRSVEGRFSANARFRLLFGVAGGSRLFSIGSFLSSPSFFLSLSLLASTSGFERTWPL